MRVEIVPQAAAAAAGELPAMEAHHVDPDTGEDELADGARRAAGAADGGRTPARRRAIPNDPATWGKVGRNEPCPCGSGKKYKHCHGRYA